MMALDLIIQKAHNKDERSALYQFMERIARRFPNLDQRKQNVFTTDRGYEAWNLPVLAESLGVSFLCRIKESDSNGILSGIRHLFPDTRRSFDREITLILTRNLGKRNSRVTIILPQIYIVNSVLAAKMFESKSG